MNGKTVIRHQKNNKQNTHTTWETQQSKTAVDLGKSETGEKENGL